MRNTQRTARDNEKAQLENEIARLKKKIEKYEAIELKQNRFGLVWLDVPEAFEDDVENKLPILEEVPKLAINSKDGKPTHLLVEGDNYHALTCLNYTHKGKIDVIYIDPPYNTGSGDFKYKDKRILDKFPDGTEVPIDHPLRHSYWLSFMRKRLELAKDILNDTGVIFINIDINELAQLKLLCDEIFLDKNFISLITVKVKDPAGVGQQSFIFDVSEYVLAYAKDLTVFKNTFTSLPLDFEEIKEQNGSYNKMILDFGKPRFVKEISRQNVGNIKIYKCLNPKIERTTKLSFKDYKKNRDKIFADYNPSGGMILAIKNEIPREGLSYLEYRPTKGRSVGQVAKAYFLNGRIVAWLSSITFVENGKLYKNSKMTNVWDIPNASLYLEGGVDFTNGKKPLKLIKKLLGLIDKPNAVVLDFFAGSGTTAEAVMDLNEQDKKNRQFILVTNNDEITNGKKHKIMTDICYPRIKNVIKGYNSKKALPNSVKYFKTAFVGKNNILAADDADKIELAHNAGGMLALAENTFDRVEQNDYWQIFSNEKQYTAVYFREEFNKFDDFIAKVKKLKQPVAVYIFSWETEFEFNDFDDDQNIKVKTIPQPILEIYKEIYNLV